MFATRTLAFASFAVGASLARAQPAPAPGASAGSAESGLVESPVTLSFDSRDALDAPARDALDAPARDALGSGADMTLGIGANLLPAWRTDRWLPIGHGFAFHAFWNKGATATWNSTYSLGESFGGGLAWHSRIGTLSIEVTIPLGGGPTAVMFNYTKSF